jgi:hypothetical protein
VELPLDVRLAVRVLNVNRIQEVQREVSAAVEFTQRWTDPALRFDRIAAGTERLDLVAAEAERRLAAIWQPAIAIENMIGQPRAQTVALSIFHDGRVVLIRRLDAEFRVDLTMTDFPFDQQRMALRFASQRHPAAEVALRMTEFDRQFSGMEGASTRWASRVIRPTSPSGRGIFSRMATEVRGCIPTSAAASWSSLRIWSATRGNG